MPDPLRNPSRFLILSIVAAIYGCTVKPSIPFKAGVSTAPSLGALSSTATVAQSSVVPPSTPLPAPAGATLAAEWSVDELYAIAWLPDSTGVAASVQEGDTTGIVLYDPVNLAERWLAASVFSLALAVSPDSRILAQPDPTEGFITFLDLPQGNQSRPPIDSPACPGAHQALFTPDGRAIVSGHFPISPFPLSDVYYWDLPTSTCQAILAGHEGLLQSLELNPPGSILATGFSELYSREPEGETTSQIKLWDFPSMSLRCWIPGLFARFTPDGHAIAVPSLSYDGIIFYDAEDCQFQGEIFGPSAPFDLSPSARLLASASIDAIAFRELATGQKLHVVPWLHDEEPSFVEYSPNGRYLLVANKGRPSSPAKITIWRVDSLEQ
jgi:WD40 repeat protein